MYRPKTKQADRVILFEIGLIIALLFVNWMLNLEYKSKDICELPEPEPDVPFVYVPYVDPPPKQEEQKQDMQLAQMNPFDPSALIKTVDDLFKFKTPDIKNLLKQPLKGPHRKIPFIQGDDKSFKVDTIVERMPHFPGGEMALKRFVQDNYRTTDAMYNYGRKVKLVVSFIVHKDGKLSDYHVVTSSVGGLGAEREAIKLFEKMPPWVPGVNANHAVNVRVLLPLTIQIY